MFRPKNGDLFAQLLWLRRSTVLNESHLVIHVWVPGCVANLLIEMPGES